MGTSGGVEFSEHRFLMFYEYSVLSNRELLLRDHNE
jgi:hypothetical protein